MTINLTKNFYCWQNILLYAILSVNFAGYWYLESLILVKIILSILMILAGYLFFKKYEIILLILTFFLLIYNTYSLYYIFNWPLAVIMFIAAIVTFFIAYYYLSNNIILSSWYIYAYSNLAALIITEFYISLLPWPVDPKSKAMILASVLYFLLNTLLLKSTGSLDKKNIYINLLILVAVVLAVIFTVKWYSY